MDEHLKGKIEIAFAEKDKQIYIPSLFRVTTQDTLLTLDDIKVAVAEHISAKKLNEDIISWYIDKAYHENFVMQNITICCGKMPVKKDDVLLEFTTEGFSVDDQVYWCFVYNLFQHLKVEDLSKILPHKLLYAKKGDIIAKKTKSIQDIEGMSVKGEVMPVEMAENNFYNAGERVHFDAATNDFIADETGYVLFHENKLKIINPFIISNDKMQFFFINYDREPFLKVQPTDISTNMQKETIKLNTLNPSINYDTPVNTPILIATGKKAVDGVDGLVKIVCDYKSQYTDVDDNTKKINYREIKKFPSVFKDDLLATKSKPIQGENGYNLYGQPIPANPPRDEKIQNGKNTYKVEKDDELQIFSLSDGLVEYKSGIISIFEQLKIANDVDYSTGNINTKVNVEIAGSVRTGFNIRSERNVFIKGTIEDNCVIYAGGDLIINGGTAGQNNKLTANGNMSVKFIEGGEIYCGGSLAVQSHIIGANVTCNDSITVVGEGVKHEEKGVIIDCEIWVKKVLYAPSIGTVGGLKSTIVFGYDKTKYNKIASLSETLKKIKESIEAISLRHPNVDIKSPNVYMQIKSFAKQVKDSIIASIQEKNKLDKQYEMIEGILNKELEQKHFDIENSSVQITNKLLPELTLECDGYRKIVDQTMTTSKFYFDFKEKKIERTRYTTSASVED